MTVAATRPAWAEVDLTAIRANAASLARVCSPAELCAVVKADGYGHGAVAVARAAIEGGASRLAVAVVEEALELREAGIGAPLLVLSDPPAAACVAAVNAGIAVTVSSASTIDAVAAAGKAAVHLKIDTGMHRTGCDPSEAPGLAAKVGERGLELEGVWTHLAVADDSDEDSVTKSQLDRFDEAVTAVTEVARPQLLHVANSAGAIHHPESRYDLARCGIALYGYAPSIERDLPSGLVLQPALSLKAEVTSVRDVPAGDGVSYGWVARRTEPRRVATIPLGYADGVPRSLGEDGGEVLIRGQRCPLAGRVTMDQFMVECDYDVVVGDEVVLLGTQGSERITADDWGELTGTISYEILSRIGPRVPRRYF